MNMHDAPAQTELGLEEQKTTRTRFLGHWLLLVRTGWLIVALLSVTLFVVSIPPFYDQLLTHSVFNLNDPAGVPARLAQLGLSIDFYAAYVTVLIIMMASVFFLVAMLIFWRKSDEWMPLIVSLVLVMFGAIFPNTLDALATAYPVLRLPTGVLDYVGFLSFFMLFYLFPDGRFVPRWTCWLALLAIVLTIPTFFFPQSVLDMNTWPPLLAVPLYMCLFGSF